MITQKLNEAHEGFILEDIEVDDLLLVLDHPKALLVKNLPNLISRNWNHPEVQSLAEALVTSHPDFYEALMDQLSLPKTISATYVKSMNGFKENIRTSLKNETLDGLNLLDLEEVPVQLELKQNSLLVYTEPTKKGLDVKKILVGSVTTQLAIASVLAGLLVINFSLADNTPKSLSAIAHHQTFEGSSALANNLNEVRKEFSQSNNPIVQDSLKMISSLSNEDLKLLERNSNLKVLLPKKEKTDQEKKDEVIQIINSFYPRKVNNVEKIASSIVKYSKRHKVDYRLMTAIIKKESDFKQSAVSTSGDISVSQIRVPTWKKQFANLKKRPLDEAKLKKDSDYAIDRMAEIMAYLKDTYEERDPYWYGRYHNWKPEFKTPYVDKVQEFLAHINLQELEITEDRLDKVSLALKQVNPELADQENLDYDSVLKASNQLDQMKKRLNSIISAKKQTIIASN